MAIKYNRDQEGGEERERRKTPWIRQGPLSRPVSRKQWFFILFAGMTTIVLLSKIALTLNKSAPYAFQTVHRGTGTVVAMEDFQAGAAAGEGAGVVTLEIPVGGDATMRGTWRIAEPYWSRLTVGSRLTVLYQVSQLGTEVRIVECGVVALSDEIR